LSAEKSDRVIVKFNVGGAGQKVQEMKTKGFTLIELLVVISIIALLMAILMPALNRVRRQTRAVACLSNLRHWGVIFRMYTDDNDHQFYGAWSTSQQGHVWIGALKPYYQDEDINFCPSATKANADNLNGLWGGAHEAYGVFPEDDIRYGYAGLAGSYGINDYVGDPAHARHPESVVGEHPWYWEKPDVRDLVCCLMHGYSFLSNRWSFHWPDGTSHQAGVAIAFLQPSTKDGTTSVRRPKMQKKYAVELTSEEQKQLTELVHKGKTAGYKIRHAHMEDVLEVYHVDEMKYLVER